MFPLPILQEPLSPQQIMLGELRIAQHQAAKGRSGVPTLDEIMEEAFQREVRSDTRAIMERMSLEEQMAIAYVPLIISHIAWHYADKALQIARRDKVSELKPLTRKFDEIRAEYNRMLRRDLNAAHISHFESEANRLLNLCAYDFTVFFYTVSNEVHRAAPRIPHDNIISYAFISVLMVRALRRHNKAVSSILIERLGPDKGSVTNPYLIALETLMLACTNDVKIDLDNQVKLCMNIFQNNISKIQFNVI
jgi:hypothetical protein